MLGTKLRKNDRCPIHNSYFCCGRVRRENRIAQKKANRSMRKTVGAKWFQVSPGVYRIPDEHHPRGYRERRTPAAMNKLLIVKMKEQENICGICFELIEDFREAGPDHIEPRGMGAARRDDHPDNIRATHNLCNLEKGSQRNFTKEVTA